MEEKIRKNLIHLGVALAIGITSFCLVFFLRRIYTYTGYSDAFFVSGAIVLACSGFAFVHRSGTFDVLHYGMGRLIAQWTHSRRRTFKNAGDYQEFSKQKRKLNPFPYYPYLGIGAILIVLAVIFMILNNVGA